jgi:DNA-binding transcriptional MerR regulator
MLEPMYNLKQVATMLNITSVTLIAWRKKGIGPNHVVINNRPYYKLSELKRWQDSLSPQVSHQ